MRKVNASIFYSQQGIDFSDKNVFMQSVFLFYWIVMMMMTKRIFEKSKVKDMHHMRYGRSISSATEYFYFTNSY